MIPDLFMGKAVSSFAEKMDKTGAEMEQKKNIKSEGIIDIHCHILPCVDDGASDFPESLMLLESEEHDGVSSVILTPHYRAGVFEMPVAKINENYEKLDGFVRERNMNLQIYLGSECRASTRLTKELAEGTVLTLAGSRYVLTEFSSLEDFENIRWGIGQLVSEGYRPIIAHAERIRDIRNDSGKMRELRRMGAEIQITADTLTRGIFDKTARIVGKMISQGLVQYAASDAHDAFIRPPRMKEAYDCTVKKYGISTADALFRKNAEQILRASESRQNEMRNESRDKSRMKAGIKAL